MTEQISTNIEGVQKCVSPQTTRSGGEPRPKRTYNRKPKPQVEEIRPPLSPDTPSNIPEPLPEKVPQKPKRTYKKKVVEVTPTPPSYVEPITEPPVLVRQTNEPTSFRDDDVSEARLEEIEGVRDTKIINDVLPTKKPRTEKQQEAFRKMREARLKKQEELSQLKAFDKEQKLMKKEHDKLNKLKEKIIYENTTPSISRSDLPVETHTASQNFVKVSNIPNYIFV